jgi:hypothetical protein
MALVRERIIPAERSQLVGEVSAKLLRIEGCRMVSVRIPYGINLDFLDRTSLEHSDKAFHYVTRTKYFTRTQKKKIAK